MKRELLYFVNSSSRACGLSTHTPTVMFRSVAATDDPNDLTTAEHRCESNTPRKLCLESVYASPATVAWSMPSRVCSSQLSLLKTKRVLDHTSAVARRLTSKAIFERYADVRSVIIEVHMVRHQTSSIVERFPSVHYRAMLFTKTCKFW